MELLLNLAWIVIAACACALWLRFPAETRNRKARFNQLIALAMLLVVLFPVISLTDDLQAAAFPAETEGVARRMMQAAHVPVPLAMTAVRIAAAEITVRDFVYHQFSPQDQPAAAVRLHPWRQADATRPPPVA